MALRAKSLFLYGFQVTQYNSSIDFRSVSLGPVRQASLNFGFYSLTSLMVEIKRAMESVDPVHRYTVTANRLINSGLENRVSISTNGSYLDLLIASGPRTASTFAQLIGFSLIDRTGSLSYTGTSSAGTVLITEYAGYGYLGPDHMRKVFGAVTVSASGDKEAIVWQVQKFIQMEFKYEPEAKVVTQWRDFLTWAIQQRVFDFTPEVNGSTFYEVTLETTSADGKGMGYTMTEMLPDFPFNYKTGLIKLRFRS